MTTTPDFSTFTVYERATSKCQIRRRRRLPMSWRVPNEISQAKVLLIESKGESCHPGHNEVCVNGVDLCPITAMMYLFAAKGFRWSNALEKAIYKVMEVSGIESKDKVEGT